MPSEPVWLSADHVERFNRLAVEQTGEPFHVRDRGLLESAVARPKHHWTYGEHSVARLAAYLLIGIARNHAFEQGNKRAALLAADAFMAVNGWRLEANDDGLADLILNMIDGRVSETDFVDIFAASAADAERRARRISSRVYRKSTLGRVTFHVRHRKR